MNNKKTKKICMVSPQGYTGMGYYDYSLCESLSRCNVDLTLFSTDAWVVNKKPSFKREVVFKGTVGDISRIRKGFNYLISWIRLIIKIISQKYYLIHFQIPEFPLVDFLFFLLLRLLRRKIIFTPHDICSFKSNIYTLGLKGLYYLSNCIIVHNKPNKYLLITKLGIQKDKIRIVLQGNFNYFLHAGMNKLELRDKINLPRNKKIILLFGNMRQGKGYETAISAFKLLKNVRNVLFLIAGKPFRDNTLNRIKKELEDTTLSEKVALRDYFIEDNLVEYYYKASDIVLVPYEYVYESAVLRYSFSCGLPTIISDIDIFSGFAKDKETCLIFRAKDANDLSEKIKILLENPDVAKSIACNAKKFSDEEWDWKIAAFETKKIYKRLISDYGAQTKGEI